MSVEIWAEISNNHNGDLNRALRLIDAAKAAGATAVKFQCYTPDELVQLRGDGPAPEPWGSDGWSMRDLYTKAETPHEWFPDLVAHCNAVGIPWFSSAFGLQSLALLESLGCERYKIAALDNKNSVLADAVRRTRKPTVVSERVFWESDYMGRNLYCPEGYPQTAFAFGDAFQHEGHIFDGFSYHGTDYTVPVYAVAAGARIVECHIQLDDEPSELEAGVSLTVSQFTQMVKEIRRVETLL